MAPSRLLRPVAPPLLALGLVLLAGADPAAADTARRLKIDLEMRRDGAVQHSADQVAGGDHATQARLQAYGQAAAACERQPAKAREACQAPAARRRRRG
jgi:hypothetical protein